MAGQDDVPRRRSRFGCRNCKLRKIKCDQGKPQCKRCISFGLLCNFVSNVPDLQPVAADGGRPLPPKVRRKAKPQLQRSLTNIVYTSDISTSYQYQLNAKCQDFITRYLRQSLITPDDPNMRHVNRQLLKLAFTHSHLMHASLAVALTYDRHLNGSRNSRRTLEECFHWSQATILLQERLRKPIETEAKDAIWGTAAALAILTYSSPEASTSGQAWPLVASEWPDDLDWIRMNRSKMALWHTVNPLRTDSVFHVFAATYAQMYSPLPERGIDGIPWDLAAACGLSDSSTAETSPYFHAAHTVSRVLDLPDSEITTGQIEPFTRTVHGAFKALLLQKDPVALLLLYLWYRKASRGIWWIELRARVECPSICTYLQLHHQDHIAVQTFHPHGTSGGVGSSLI